MNNISTSIADFPLIVELLKIRQENQSLKPREEIKPLKSDSVSEYTIDNPKLVEFHYTFAGARYFTGVAKDKHGTITHYVDGYVHREGAPAIELVDGTKFWQINSKNHRKDGPSMEYPDGRKEWWFNDHHYGSNDAFTNESWAAYVATLT